MNKKQISEVMSEFAKRGRNNLKKKLGKKGFSEYMGELSRKRKKKRTVDNSLTAKRTV